MLEGDRNHGGFPYFHGQARFSPEQWVPGRSPAKLGSSFPAVRAGSRGRLRLEDESPPGIIENRPEVAQGFDADVPGQAFAGG